MLPFLEYQDTPNTAGIFEDVTFERDVAAQQLLDNVSAARPTASQSVVAIKRLDRQRRDDANADKKPPSTTGHPILDAVLDEFRNNLRMPGSLQPTLDSS